jgi:hypothetical protein
MRAALEPFLLITHRLEGYARRHIEREPGAGPGPQRAPRFAQKLRKRVIDLILRLFASVEGRIVPPGGYASRADTPGGFAPAPGFRRSQSAVRTGAIMTTPTDREWMSAYEALRFLQLLRADAARAICARARAGLVKARAKLLIYGSQRHYDADVPHHFWWEEGEEALKQNWPTGDFATWNRHYTVRQEAFGVEFWRSDIEQLKPAPEPATRREFAFGPPLRSVPTEPKKPLIFVSYAHADEPETPAEGEIKWLSFVTGYLRPAMKHGAVDLWLDRLMPGGSNWEREIEPKLRACDIFILLVSRHSLSSDYVVDKEIALVRDRQTKGEDVHFYPLVLTSTPRIALDLVRDMNLRPRDGKPLSDYSIHERYRHKSDVSDEIVAIAEGIAASQKGSRAEMGQHLTAKTRSRLRLSIGEEMPFFKTKSKMYGIQRTNYIKIENVDDEKHVTDIKLTIHNIEPQNEYVGPWEIESGFALAAGDYKFVPFVQYGEANSIGYSTSAYSRSDSFFVFLTKGGVGRQPTGPKAIPQTILIRATGIGTAPCDYVCRVWVQDPDGRLRIAASSTSTGTPAAPAENSHGIPVEIKDSETLEAWLKGQSPEVAIAIAARAALRVVPRAVTASGVIPKSALSELASAVFRMNASTQAAVRYPGRVEPLAAAFGGFVSNSPGPRFVSPAESSAQAAARAAFGRDSFARASAVDTAARAATGLTQEAADLIWRALQADAVVAPAIGAIGLMDLPLWSDAGPAWANEEWISLKTTLPKEEDWEIWIDWYEDQLRGGSRGEAYELVFASVPMEVWKQGPATANVWIREHLPLSESISIQDSLDARVIGANESNDFERRTPSELTEPLPDFDSPFTYGWNTKFRVEVIAGAQNLPFFPYFSSEEDHRHALEACRVGGERLLKALRDGRYNARNEYGEALEYYLDDLPKTAGAGNILLANDQVRILHGMFLADGAVLSEGFASRLKSVITNQFALNGFYDLVQRHNAAVNAGNWTQPFPSEAARRFFGVVEENTPQLFEPEVGNGLRQVERAAPQPAATTEVPSSPSAIQPPPLPPGTPDAEHSRQRQIATAANALWAVFLKGKDLPTALE